MVDLSDVISSNERIASQFPDGLVIVFVGGTSGVGEYTLKKFAKYAPKSRAYIIGRSREAATRIVKECQELSPESEFEFIEADISLVKKVDDVCNQIKTKEKVINILFQSQGSVSMRDTAEGLPFVTTLYVHSRIRFILNLLPMIQKANSLRRIVCVAAGTYEGHIDTSSLHGTHLPLLQRRDHLAGIHTILHQEASKSAPDVTFIHTVPGFVRGGMARDAKGMMAVRFAIASFLARLIEVPTEESGHRHLFVATSARYPSVKNTDKVSGVIVKGTVVVARGINGKDGSGVYSVDPKDESAPPKVESIVAKYKEDGTYKLVWDSIVADLKKVTGTEAVL